MKYSYPQMQGGQNTFRDGWLIKQTKLDLNSDRFTSKIQVQKEEQSSMQREVFDIPMHRWFNHLRPSIVKEEWTKQEQDILFEQHAQVGNKWIVIAEQLPGRSDNCIKNHFYSVIRKSLRRINKFLGLANGTHKIRKIKPQILSQIFNIQKYTKQDNTEYDVLEHAQMQESQGIQLVYNLINFSRINLTANKPVLGDEEMSIFVKLLQAVQNFNDKYLKERDLKKKNRIQQQKFQKFDHVIEKEEQEQVSDDDDQFQSSSQQLQSSSQQMQQLAAKPTKNTQTLTIFPPSSPAPPLQHNSSACSMQIQIPDIFSLQVSITPTLMDYRHRKMCQCGYSWDSGIDLDCRLEEIKGTLERKNYEDGGDEGFDTFNF